MQAAPGEHAVRAKDGTGRAQYYANNKAYHVPQCNCPACFDSWKKQQSLLAPTEGSRRARRPPERFEYVCLPCGG